MRAILSDDYSNQIIIFHSEGMTWTSGLPIWSIYTVGQYVHFNKILLRTYNMSSKMLHVLLQIKDNRALDAVHRGQILL